MIEEKFGGKRTDPEEQKNVIDAAFERLKELPAVREAFEIIENKLAEKYPELAEKFPGEILPYHGKHHSENVLREAIALALEDGTLSGKEMELLAIAAAFHDSGFIEQYDANEEIGAKLSAETMRKLGYNDEDIERVSQAILSTRVEFDPGFTQKVNKEDMLSRLIADADVGNFGRQDFSEKSGQVFKELVAMGKMGDTPEARAGFNKFSLNMLKSHKWQTEAAARLHSEQKQKNIEELGILVAG